MNKKIELVKSSIKYWNDILYNNKIFKPKFCDLCKTFKSEHCIGCPALDYNGANCRGGMMRE